MSLVDIAVHIRNTEFTQRMYTKTLWNARMQSLCRLCSHEVFYKDEQTLSYGVITVLTSCIMYTKSRKNERHHWDFITSSHTPLLWLSYLAWYPVFALFQLLVFFENYTGTWSARWTRAIASFKCVPNLEKQCWLSFCWLVHALQVCHKALYKRQGCPCKPQNSSCKVASNQAQMHKEKFICHRPSRKSFLIQCSGPLRHSTSQEYVIRHTQTQFFLQTR